MAPTGAQRVVRIVSTALALATLVLFLVIVGTPADAVALLAVCAVILTATLFAVIGVDDVPETTPLSDRAPPPSRALEPTPAPGESPPPPMSTILNPHPDNRRRRTSRAERELVVWELTRHFTDDRLTDSEFDSRHDKALKAVTRGDLADLLDDLPRLNGYPRP